MLVDIRHSSYGETTDGLLRELHAAAKTTRSATVLAALERAAQTYYRLAYAELATDNGEVVATELLNELAA